MPPLEYTQTTGSTPILPKKLTPVLVTCTLPRTTLSEIGEIEDEETETEAKAKDSRSWYEDGTYSKGKGEKEWKDGEENEEYEVQRQSNGEGEGAGENGEIAKNEEREEGHIERSSKGYGTTAEPIPTNQSAPLSSPYFPELLPPQLPPLPPPPPMRLHAQHHHHPVPPQTAHELMTMSPSPNTLSTLDMIISIIGDFFGQRDLLEERRFHGFREGLGDGGTGGREWIRERKGEGRRAVSMA
ncbi:hypothetical protein BDZ91DRAFT_786937 [Kalaharituber pfeilii]|nr:hypothetical protein BDZ91DRAFT_786937 [Kalaharituber pfeilii]